MQMNNSTTQLDDQERRRYSRVAVHRGGWISGQNEKQRFDQVRNLSMGGACLQGRNELLPGDFCELELHEDGRHSTRIIKLCGRVIRASSDDVAMQFVHMDLESYMFLQTLVLYNADDPLGIVSEFQDEFPQASTAASC